MGTQRRRFLVILVVILDSLIGIWAPGTPVCSSTGPSHSAPPLPRAQPLWHCWYTCETVWTSLGGRCRQHVLSKQREVKQPSEACSWSESRRCAASVELSAASLLSHTHGVWSRGTAARHLAKWTCVSRLLKAAPPPLLDLLLAGCKYTCRPAKQDCLPQTPTPPSSHPLPG